MTNSTTKLNILEKIAQAVKNNKENPINVRLQNANETLSSISLDTRGDNITIEQLKNAYTKLNNSNKNVFDYETLAQGTLIAIENTYGLEETLNTAVKKISIIDSRLTKTEIVVDWAKKTIFDEASKKGYSTLYEKNLEQVNSDNDCKISDGQAYIAFKLDEETFKYTHCKAPKPYKLYYSNSILNNEGEMEALGYVNEDNLDNGGKLNIDASQYVDCSGGDSNCYVYATN